MSNRVSKQSKAIEALFLLAETATVKELYEALFGEVVGTKTNRELSQAIGPALTRYCRRSGNDVHPTGEPYTYAIAYA